MKSIAYHSFADYVNKDGISKCSVERLDMPLAVNCAGYSDIGHAFVTHNARGRLDYYLIYVRCGDLTVFDGDCGITVTEGSVVLLPAGKPYKYASAGEKRLGYFWVHFSGSEVCSRLLEYKFEFFPAVHHAREDNHIPQRFQSIFDAYVRGDDLRDRELSALLDRLLITTSRAVNRDSLAASTLSRSIKHLAEHYNVELKIPELAKMEHLSVSRYNFLFKKQLGVSPKQHILSLRMSSAADLLLSTDLAIKEIADMCGYSDAQFFAKTFKSYFGVTPTEYRGRK